MSRFRGTERVRSKKYKDWRKSMITISNMTKKYVTGDQELLANNNINLTINKGEFVVILGPSAAANPPY